MRDHPELGDCAVLCFHCGIRFLTHPRNARRQNLRCAFGCRQHRRRQRGNARSRKHSETDSARRKKKGLNGKRSKSVSDTDAASPHDVPAPPALPEAPTTPEESSDAPRAHHGAEAVSDSVSHDATEATLENVTLSLEGFVLDDSTLVNSHILPYVLIVASILERRTIRREELIAALRTSMRQRSIDLRPRREYVLRLLKQHPP